MTHDVPAYGLWTLVILNSLAFIVALFAEMYGFPLTIYLLSGWLRRRATRVWTCCRTTPGTSGGPSSA